MATLVDIHIAAQTVAGMAPHLGPGAHLSPRVRDALRVLAEACGMRAATIARANDVDLISLQQVAKKDPAAARRVAERIALRLDDTLLSATPEPAAPPAAPPPAQPLPGAPVDPEAVRALVRSEMGDVLAPLQRSLDDFAATIPTQTLEAVRAEIAIAAHAAAREALANLTPTALTVVSPNNPEPVQLGLVHRKTPQIINALKAGVNVYLHGPAGSGKTTVARKAAEAFGLQFYFAAKVESEYMLLGFKDAKGETVRTPFRDAYEHGGVFLFDEMDASSPAAVVALNAALANGICPFPDAIVNRHPDFYCLGAGNTKLTGANRQYQGRNQLDAASIDRFAFIEFGYDDDLERALAGDATWCAYVQRVRAVVLERGLPHLVTPRATYDGCKLLAAGFDRDTVAEMVVFKGLDDATRAQIIDAL